jgi:protocatechuate 3,4-dioxygenase beta subunit
MRRVWVAFALLAVVALVVFYLAGAGGARARATNEARPADAPETPAEPSAPEPPPDPNAKFARLLVHDPEGNPIAAATAGLAAGAEGDEVKTGADGRCAVPLPGDGWCEIAVRHPDFVKERTWARSIDLEERVVVLQRGTRFSVVVLDPLRKPVAGADVRVSWHRSHGASGVWRWSDSDVLGEFRTDAEGRAAVGAVPQATIVVKVDREPFAVHESRLDVTGDDPVEHVVELDAGGILLGRVIAPGGEGVPGAVVMCQDLVRPVTKAEAGGAFRLEGVAPGSVQLVAEAEGFGPGFFGAGLGWGQPVPIPLKSGETVTGLEIVLSKPVYVVGRIVDDTGQPVADVSVGAWIQRGFSLGGQAKSDAEGRFRVGPFSVREPSGVWAWFMAPLHQIEQATARAEPGRDADLGEIKATRCATVRGTVVGHDGRPVEGRVTVAQVSVAAKPDGTFEAQGVEPSMRVHVVGEAPSLKSAPLVLEVAAGQTIDGVEVVLQPTKAIRGRVITPDGRPRPGVSLGIRRASDSSRVAGDTTDAEGKFEFKDLIDGEYELGLYGRDAVSLNPDETPFLEDPAPVKAKAGREDIEFVLPLKGAIVIGKVVAKRDGRPLKEFDATFLRYKLFIPTDSDLEGYREGEFRYEAEEPGTWQVEVAAPGYAAHRTERFSLAAGEVKDLGTIRLGPGGTIAGTIVDAQQRPVPYARVNILNDKLQTNEDEPYSDLQGRFEVKGVSPGMFTVFAVEPRHPLGIVRGVEVREGERTDVHVVFVEPAPLTIDVQDTAGQPVEGAALDFTFPAVAPLTSRLFRGKIPPGYGSHRSDAQGRIFLPCLPPGEVTISIESKDFETVTKKLELKPGEPNRVEIRLRRTGG